MCDFQLSKLERERLERINENKRRMQEIGLGEAAAAVRQLSQAQPAPSQNGPKRKRVYERIIIGEEDLRRSDRRVRRTRHLRRSGRRGSGGGRWQRGAAAQRHCTLQEGGSWWAVGRAAARLPPASRLLLFDTHLPLLVFAGPGRTSTTTSSSSSNKPRQRCAAPPGRGEEAA